MSIEVDKNLFSEITKTIYNELNSSTDKIYNSLVENKESYCNSLPESIFVNYFLPFFIGQRNDNENWLLEWISIAGTPSSYVRIFKDGDVNRTLFFVPPVLNTNIINNDISLKSIIETSNNYSNNIPIVGTRFLFEALQDKSNKMLSNFNNSYINEWVSIFNYYNLIPKQESSSNSNNSSLDNYFEY